MSPYQMSYVAPPLSLLMGSLLSWLLLRVAIPVLRRQLIDHPNSRSAHQEPTPRGGGMAFVIVGTLLAPISGPTPMAWIPMASCPLALVGIIDDRFDIPATIRYATQLLTAIVLITIAILPIPWWLYPVILIAITALINFVNFMDGLDGLVGTCCAIILTTAPISSFFHRQSEFPEFMLNSLWPLIGALIGFLLWNWSPAKVFMGDVGSTFLGAVIAGTILQQTTITEATMLLLVGFPLFADSALCVFRRLSDGQPIFKAHKLHLFQRLHQAGWSHAKVTITYAIGTTLLALAFIGEFPIMMIILVATELAFGLWLDRNVAIPFSGLANTSSNGKI